MVGSTLGVYGFGLIFVSARTNKRHHHPRGFGWRIYCGVEVTESSTNKQHSLSIIMNLVL
jgi:hypothetical protein